MQQADGRNFAVTVIVHDVDIAAYELPNRIFIDMDLENVAVETGLEHSQKC